MACVCVRVRRWKIDSELHWKHIAFDEFRWLDLFEKNFTNDSLANVVQLCITLFWISFQPILNRNLSNSLKFDSTNYNAIFIHKWFGIYLCAWEQKQCAIFTMQLRENYRLYILQSSGNWLKIVLLNENYVVAILRSVFFYLFVLGRSYNIYSGFLQFFLLMIKNWLNSKFFFSTLRLISIDLGLIYWNTKWCRLSIYWPKIVQKSNDNIYDS